MASIRGALPVCDPGAGLPASCPRGVLRKDGSLVMLPDGARLCEPVPAVRSLRARSFGNPDRATERRY